MKETYVVNAFKTVWDPECNSLHHKLLSKEVSIDLPLSLSILKIFLIVVSILWLPLLIVAGILHQCQLYIIGGVTGLVGILCASCMLLWFKYSEGSDRLHSKAQKDFEDELKPLNDEQVVMCEKWRAEHPLEEQCRKVFPNNANEVAKLVRMLKEVFYGRS